MAFTLKIEKNRRSRAHPAFFKSSMNRCIMRIPTSVETVTGSLDQVFCGELDRGPETYLCSLVYEAKWRGTGEGEGEAEHRLPPQNLTLR